MFTQIISKYPSWLKSLTKDVIAKCGFTTPLFSSVGAKVPSSFWTKNLLGNLNNLFGATLTNHSYTYNDGENEYPLNISYTSNNTAVKSFNDIPHTGMIFDVLSEDPSRETYYRTVFINVGAKDTQSQLNRMFTAHPADYGLEDFCT